MPSDYFNNIDRSIEELDLIATSISGEIHALGERANGLGSTLKDFVAKRVEEVGSAIQEHRRTTEARFGGVDNRFVGVDNRIDGVDARVVTANQSLGELIKRVTKLEHVVGGHPAIVRTLAGAGVVPAPPDTNKAELFIKCLRVINQAEDLITDDSFNPDKNSKDLETKHKQQATKDAIASVTDKALSGRFDDIYAPFDGKMKPNDLKRARIERAVAIQQLRQDLAVFFSS